MIDIVGYIAIGLALVAMISKQIIVLRWIHLTSCVFYAVYGFITDTNPVTLGAILFGGIHIYHLHRIYISKKIKS